MLDLKQLEADPAGTERALRRRGAIPGLEDVLALAEERRVLIGRVQAGNEQRNEINKGMKGASKELIDERRTELRALSDAIKDDDKLRADVEERLEGLLLTLPNPPRDDVPEGKDESGNVEIRRLLEPAALSFPAKDHVELGGSLGLLDFERAAKLSGARFSVLRGVGAQLSRALASFMLDFHTSRGDLELAPPLLVGPSALLGTGQLPKFEDDLFKVPRGDAGPLYLIPTAEVPLTNYFADEILEEEQLPVRLCAWTPCFRAEAGAAGRDTRGLIRQHQFDKVEMVRFCTPEQADAELEAMVQRASDILTALELPHRVMLLCTGDMGATAEKTYDLEVWLPGQDAYREISSCSTCGSYQARRAKIRYRPAGEGPKKPKPRALVTLNGSGLAVGRTWLALLENHQQEDGSVRVPAALRPYLGGRESLTA
jgi:seryl-tRNA synthetase